MNLSQKDKQIISKEIQDLLDLGVISRCKDDSNQFLSSVFTILKRDGSYRFILNLKNLNKFVVSYHFKLEDIRTVCKLLSKDDFMCTIDLKHAYYMCPIDAEYKKYLRFKFNDILYEYNCLAFGLSSAPYVFTKLLKPVVGFLRERGIRLVIYLDDLICFGSSYNECSNNAKIVKNLLTCLGFVINYEKSSLIPTKITEFLGFKINSNSMTLSPTDLKREKVLLLVNKFLKLQVCTIREFAKMLGTLVSICMAISYGFVYTKNLERDKFRALERLGGDYDGEMTISEDARMDLKWWQNKISKGHCHIKQYNFSLEIYSDASLSGWGSVCNGRFAKGSWSAEEKESHINYLELLAAFFALKCFASHLSKCEILLRIDNTTAISYINRMGSVQFPKLNSLAKQIWQWCEARELWIFASYIKSKDNVEADYQSRSSNDDTEWELSPSVFCSIQNSLGIPIIDLFASRLNYKCARYVSWHRDPFAWNIDAFTIRWSEFFYAFPPFALILKVLRKIITDKATGILVFPVWPTQNWYPLLRSLIVSEIITFGPDKDLLISPSRSAHPLHQQLTLGACILSGRR